MSLSRVVGLGWVVGEEWDLCVGLGQGRGEFILLSEIQDQRNHGEGADWPEAGEE